MVHQCVHKGFYGILCTIYFLTRCAQSFTVTPKDVATQPNIIQGRKNADSWSKTREDGLCELPEGELPAAEMHLAEGNFVTSFICSSWEMLRLHLHWDIAPGYLLGMLPAVDAWSATALQQPWLIHRLKLGRKSHRSPQMQRTCMISASVGFGSLGFFNLLR